MVAILMVMYAIAFLDRQVIGLMVGPIRADLGLTDFQLSLLQGIGFALFYALFGLPLGWLVDRFSRRWIIFGGIMIWSAAAAAGGLARTVTDLFFARLGVGAGEAALAPAAYSMVADSFPRRRLTVAMAAVNAGASLGAAMSIFLGGLLVAYAISQPHLSLPIVGEVRSWQFVFIVTGIPGIFVGMLMILVREPQRRGQRPRADRAPLIPFLRMNARMFIGHFGGFAMIQTMAFAVFNWSPTYMIRHFGWNVSDVGLVLAILSMTTIGSALLLGAAVDRWFQKGRTDAHMRLYILAAPLAAIFFGTAFLIDNPIGFLIFYGLATGLLPMAGIASAALQLVTPNELRGQIIALFLLTMNLIGLGVGPSLTAFFTDFVFRDDAMVGWSMFAAAALTAPIAAGLLWFGGQGMRDAVGRAVKAD